MRAESAKRTVEIGFDGYGIGGLSVGETREEMLPALAAAIEHLPTDRPRYLMGVGDPASLVEAVGLGVDQFDCVMQTRLGRHGTALTSTGRFQAKAARNAELDEPLDPELPVRGVRPPQPRLHPAPAPGRRADRVPAALDPQHRLDDRPHGADADGDPRRARSSRCAAMCSTCGDSICCRHDSNLLTILAPEPTRRPPAGAASSRSRCCR